MEKKLSTIYHGKSLNYGRNLYFLISIFDDSVQRVCLVVRKTEMTSGYRAMARPNARAKQYILCGELVFFFSLEATSLKFPNRCCNQNHFASDENEKTQASTFQSRLFGVFSMFCHYWITSTAKNKHEQS